MSCPSTLASANASRIASTSAFICASCGWVAKSGSFRSRSSGNPATPAPSCPLSLSTIATRTLCVPKSTPATIGTVLRVLVNVPAEISRRRLVHRVGHGRHRAGDVMLEAGLADETQQLLQARNLYYTSAAERRERIIGESSVTHVATNATAAIVGREARIRHWVCLHLSHDCAVRIFASHRTGYDRLIVHLHVFEESLRQVAAVETDGLVWILSVVVVPVQQRARRLRCECQRVHADGAAHVHLACAGKIHVAHHAHDGAWHDAEELFHRGPALDRAHRHVSFLHPAVDHEAELRHLDERFRWNAIRAYVCLDLVELGANVRVVIRQPVNTAEDLGQVDGFHSDPRGLEDLLTEPHRLEGSRPRADRADARTLETSHHAAHAREAAQVRAEAIGFRPLGVQ